MCYDTLAFTLHRTCNASCSICCFSSDPDCKEKLNIKRIKEYIDEAKDIDQIKTISFTGGEPFLDYDNLIELVYYAYVANKRITVITNGFWATDYEKTFEMMYRLKQCGLKHLSLSHDLYHKEFIKTENIKNILKVAAKLNIPTSIAIAKMKNEEVGKIIDEIGSDIYTASLKVGPCLPIGRATNNFSNEDFDRTLKSKDAKCMYGKNLAVCYDGTIYPCCSQVVIETGLGIGNFEDISLKDALKKLKNNALLYFLRNSNMDFYTNFAKEKLKMEIPDYVVNPCELCAILFKNDNLNMFYDYVIENIKSKKIRKGHFDK